MKNVRTKTSWLFGLILATALLLLATIISQASAYFTSTTKKSGDVVFANMNLVIDSTNDDGALFAEELTEIVPGNTIEFKNLSVRNDGEADVYMLLNLNVYTTRTGYTDYVDDRWYNMAGDRVDVLNMDTNTVEATKLLTTTPQTIDLTYTFDGNIFDNTFKNVKPKITLRAVAVQASNLQQIDSSTDPELIATKLLINDFCTLTANNIADLSQLDSVPALASTTPSQTLTDSGVTYNLYNFSLANASAGDTVYVQAAGAEQVFIAPGNHDLTTLLTDYTTNGTLPEGTIQAYGQTVTTFTVEDETQVVALSSIKRTSSSGFNGNFAVATVSTSSTQPTVRVYTTPQDDMPSIEDDLGVYLVDYADVATDYVTYSTPIETSYLGDGLYLDAFYFNVQNITQNSTIYVCTSANAGGIGDDHIPMSEMLEHFSAGTVPPNTVFELSSQREFCVHSFNLTAGEELNFFVFDITDSHNSSIVQIYCVPQGDLPGVQDGVAYRLLADGTGYSAFVAHDIVESAIILDSFLGLPVKEVEEHGFYGLSISSVSIGNNVETIGKSAFEECDSLTSVTIPSSVQIVGWYSFFSCDNLTTVTFAENSKLTIIGGEAFSNCTSLTEITIPESVTTMGYAVFNDCSGLTTLNLQTKDGYVWLIYNGNALIAYDATTLTQSELITYAKDSKYTFKQMEK